MHMQGRKAQRSKTDQLSWCFLSFHWLYGNPHWQVVAMVENQQVQKASGFAWHNGSRCGIYDRKTANEQVVIRCTVFHLVVAETKDAVYLQWRDPAIS